MAVARDQALSAYFRRPRLLRRLTRGHVNESWLVAEGDRRFVLQRINRHAFKDLRVVARNAANASRLLRSRDVRTVRIRATRAGEPWFFDDADNFWRAYAYVARSQQPGCVVEIAGDDMQVIEGHPVDPLHHEASIVVRDEPRFVDVTSGKSTQQSWVTEVGAQRLIACDCHRRSVNALVE